MQNYSVLMSVYFKEAPEYLRQAIESIQAQTFPTDDFVLVCDGPLNDALDAAIAEKQQEMGSALNVVRLVKNGGLGNALNEGIKHCKNELVARMDSDDISVMDRCQKQVELFEKNPELDITSGALLEFVTSPDQITGGRTIPCNNNEIIPYSRKRCPFNHPCVMFKKSAVESAGGYQEKYHLFEDYYLWIRMLQNGCNAQNLPDVLLYMRTPTDMYLRRGGAAYAKAMLRFHWWVHKSGWTSLVDFCTGALPHALVCVMPNKLRKMIYQVLHS
jgi:glycosyltransferase involved in cell wall biosynthesis